MNVCECVCDIRFFLFSFKNLDKKKIIYVKEKKKNNLEGGE